MSSRARTGLLLGALLAGALYLAGLASDHFWLRLCAKPWPILALIATLSAASGPRSERAHYPRWIVRGLWLCLLGDLLLEERDKLFLPGVLAFLAGHVCYLVAYTGADRRLRPLLALPIGLWGAGLFLHLRPGLGHMTIPLAVYAGVLCAMMWRAAALLGGEALGERAALLAAGGALLFGISDSLIALNRWGGGIPHARYAIITLYWLGQAGITGSALRKPEG